MLFTPAARYLPPLPGCLALARGERSEFLSDLVVTLSDASWFGR
jgi:hypothetical protein